MSPAEDPRIALIREASDAFSRGDLSVILAALDPEVVSYVSPALMNAGTWHGVEGFTAMVEAWSEAWAELSFEVVDHELVDERNVLVVLKQGAVGRGSGVPVELDIVYLVEFGERGVLRFEIHADRESARAAL